MQTNEFGGILMNKTVLFILSLLQLLLGILGAAALIIGIMGNNTITNLIFDGILMLFGFYLGIKGIKKLMNKDIGEEGDKNEQESCSGG